MKIKQGATTGITTLLLLTIRSLLVIAAAICVPERLNAQAVANSKPVMGGSFFSLTLNRPPLPFNPFPELSVTEVKPGVFVYDDTSIDYIALQQEQIALQNAKMAEGILQFDELDGGGGGMMMLMGEGGTNLMLSIPVIQGANLSMQIINANTNEPYDLYATTTLGSTNAWLYLGRAPAGQTNLSPSVITGPIAAFTVANTADTDGDTLPDALEELATQTNPQAADTQQTVPPGSLAASLLTNVLPRVVVKSYSESFYSSSLCEDGVTKKWDQVDTSYAWSVGGTQVAVSASCAMERQTNTLIFDGYGTPIPPLGWSIPATTGEHRACESGDPNTSYVRHNITALLELRTGGKALSSREHLFVFRPEVIGNHDCFNGPPSQAFNLPTSDYTFLGQHVDTGGRVWAKFPDNQQIAVSVEASPQYSNYTVYATGFGKYDFQLRLRGSNITDSTQTVWVGERMELDAILAPGGILISNFTWSVPGDIIASYTATANLGKVYNVSNYTNASMSFCWWKAGTSFDVQCSAVVNGISLNAKATFKVQKPDVQIAAVLHDVVKVDNLYQNAARDALHLGGYNNVPGIRFTRTPDDSGSWAWLQIINTVRRQRFAVDGHWERFAGAGLDNAFPYPVPEQSYKTEDSPGMQFADGTHEATISEGFFMYLMYKPFTSGSTWVPLRRIEWSWSGSAVFQNNTWSMVPGSDSRNVDAAAIEATEFPQWESNFLLFDWLPE